MVDISNCPKSGLARKVEKNLQKLETVKQVILECKVHCFNAQGEQIRTRSIIEFTHKLTAHNGIYVNPFTVANPGKKWTKEESDIYDAQIKLIADYPAKKAAYDKYVLALADWEKGGSVGSGPVAVANPGANPPAQPAVIPMGQYDFFFALSKTKVNMDELELKEIAEADAAGKFND